METAITLGGLVLPAGKLICKIIQAAETATQNKAECADLAGRLSVLHKLLLHLRLHGPEAEEVLSGLGHTLDDAHELVVACHRWGAPRKLAFAGAHAERFTKLNRRIDSHLNLIQLCCHIDVSRRLDDHASLLHPLAPAVAADDCKVSLSGNHPRSQQLGATCGSRCPECGPKCDQPLDGVSIHEGTDGQTPQNSDLGGSSPPELQTTPVEDEGPKLEIPFPRPRSKGAGIPPRSNGDSESSCQAEPQALHVEVEGSILQNSNRPRSKCAGISRPRSKGAGVPPRSIEDLGGLSPAKDQALRLKLYDLMFQDSNYVLPRPRSKGAGIPPRSNGDSGGSSQAEPQTLHVEVEGSILQNSNHPFPRPRSKGAGIPPRSTEDLGGLSPAEDQARRLELYDLLLQDSNYVSSRP